MTMLSIFPDFGRRKIFEKRAATMALMASPAPKKSSMDKREHLRMRKPGILSAG
jgi:hypothetical protein